MTGSLISQGVEQPPQDEIEAQDRQPLTKRQFTSSLLAAMSDFLDAGAIVAGGASFSIWVVAYHLSSARVGLVAALGANGISAGIGAFIGGRLGDRYGRKTIYVYDMLVYMVGALIVILGQDLAMVITGYMIMGLAIGADIPCSWSLISEGAPIKSRNKLMATTNILWYVGPIIILALAIAWKSHGLLGTRLLFVVLFVVAAVTFIFRRGMAESLRWQSQKKHSISWHQTIEMLKRPTVYKSFLFLIPLYILWTLPAGTYGVFLPYVLKSTGTTSANGADLFEMVWFGSAIAAVVLVFIPLCDRISNRMLFGISAACMAAGFYLIIFVPMKSPTVALINILLFGFGQGIGVWPLLRIWSVALYPTENRNTFQGVTWGIKKLSIGLWSLYLPTWTAGEGISAIAIPVALMFTALLVIGVLFAPEVSGRSLEQIQQDLQSKWGPRGASAHNIP